jgi:AAA ATPase domain
VAAEAAGTLLEREHELTELGQVLAAAQHGRGRCVLVEAAAGLGKTSLLRAASGTAAGMGFAHCRGRASGLERDFAYGCVRQLLEPVLARMLAPSVTGCSRVPRPWPGRCSPRPPPGPGSRWPTRRSRGCTAFTG